MASAEPPRRVDNSLPPAFQEIGAYRFQRFAADLLAREPGVATADEYGVNGQADRGVDVLARRLDGDGQEAASCKCYERTTAEKVREWSDEFLDHWDAHWKSQDLRRFVLITSATNADRTEIQDQITRERARFRALGLAYELWGPRTLVNKLRPARAVATAYLNEGWAATICGPLETASVPAGPASGLVSAALIGQVAALQRQFSDQALDLANRALDDLRAGRIDVVRTLVERQRGPDVWSQLDARAQARILRLDASLALQGHDVGTAARLSDEADAIMAPDEPRLAAHVALERDGAGEALATLGDVDSAAGLQLRVTLLVFAGRASEADGELRRLLDVDPADPETVRLEALVALARNERVAALSHVRRAEAAAPHWRAVRQLGAIVRYAAALSPALPPEWFLSPNAFDGAFVLEDVASQALLGEAVALLDQLVAAEPDEELHRIWRLAALSSMRASRERARSEATDLLIRSGHNEVVVAWCVFRGIDVDLGESETALLARYAEGAGPTVATVLGLLLGRREDRSTAVAAFRAGLDRQGEESRREAARWIARLSDEPSDPGETLDPDEDGLDASLGAARTSEDWSAVLTRLGGLLGRDPPAPAGLPLAEAISGAGKIELLAPHADALLRFRTPTAVRLALFAARAFGPERVLELLETNAGAFGEALPPDVRRLRADAMARSGDIRSALREADQIAGAGTVADRLFRAEIVSTTGDVRAAAPAVREALGAGLLDGDRAFRWSRVLRADDPELSRSLLRRAIGSGLSDGLVTAATHDALRLDLGGEAAPLLSRLHERATGDAPDVRLIGIDDLPAIMAEQASSATEQERLFLDGAVPAHLHFASRPADFAAFHLSEPKPAGTPLAAWATRHGSRPAHVETAEWADWRIHMDVSALLVAGRLGLLDFLEAHPNGVAVAADLPMLLLSMESGLRDRSEAVDAGRVLAAAPHPAGLAAEPARRVGVDADADLGLRALVAGLVERRAIEPERADRVLDGLHDDRPTGGSPPDGAAILLDAAALLRLARADALAPVTARFRVECDPQLLDQAADAVRHAEEALRQADAVARLRVRVATGLQAGTYRLIARAGNQGEEDEVDGEADLAASPLVRAFHDLIAAPGAHGAVAWIDDRMTTGFARTAEMPVVGVADALEAMRRADVLGTAERNAARAQLRAGGALFQVFEAEEIVRHLLAAPVQGQRVVETGPLATLRRSLAHGALNERYLAIGSARDAPADRPDEVVPVQSAMRLLAGGLDLVWTRPGLTHDERIAYSDWLWRNCRRTHLDRRIPGDRPEAAQDMFEVLQIASCFDRALDVGGLRDERRELRLLYLRWLWTRAAEPLVRVDSTFLPRLARYLADLYSGLEQRHTAGRRGRERRMVLVLLARRVGRLPEIVRDEVFKDARMATFGRAEERVTFAGVHVESARFWRAARRAMRYGEATLRLRRRGKGRLRTMRLRRDGAALVATGAVRFRLDDPILQAATTEGEVRDRAVSAVLDELRLDEAERRRAEDCARLAGSAAELASALRDAHQSSARGRRDDLARTLGRGERVRLDAFAPASHGANVAWLGLEGDDGPLDAALTRARARAPDAVEAMIASAGVPVVWVDPPHGDDLDAALRRARTPMALIHLTGALVADGRTTEEVGAACDRLLDAVQRSGDLFCELLRWTHRHFLRDADWRAAAPDRALASVWAHADRMLDVAIGAGLDPDRLRTDLEGFGADVAGVDLLLTFPPGRPDAAWPPWISPAALLFHGLAAIFRDSDAAEALGATRADRVYDVLLTARGSVVMPEAKLLVRRPDWPNATNGFLASRPRGILDGSIDVERFRAVLTSNALDGVEADLENPAAWLQLGAFAIGGVDATTRSRLEALVVGNVGRLTRIAASTGSYQVWRATLGGIAVDNWRSATRHAVALARACRWLVLATPASGLDPDGAVEELVELSAMIAACAGEGREQVFRELIEAIGSAWPDCLPDLRSVADNLVARTPSGRVDEFWRLLQGLSAR